jgi:16S rRNA C967 or C1407 C5-methylase (RsmB/RsmF family)
MVYSTCSISPDENDGALERFTAKRRGLWTLVERSLTLPDEAGEGPLFYAVIRKNEPHP